MTRLHRQPQAAEATVRRKLSGHRVAGPWWVQHIGIRMKEGVVAGLVDHGLREDWRCELHRYDQGRANEFMSYRHRSPPVGGLRFGLSRPSAEWTDLCAPTFPADRAPLITLRRGSRYRFMEEQQARAGYSLNDVVLANARTITTGRGSSAGRRHRVPPI